MNILQCIDSLRIGGAEVLAATLAAGLAAHGHRCCVCGIGQEGELACMLDRLGIRYSALIMPHGASLRLVLKLAALARRESAEVLLTHHFRQLFHAAPAAVLLRKRLVHVEHDYYSYKKSPELLRRLDILLRFTHRFVAVSPEIADWFRERSSIAAKKLITIENGIDTERFRPNSSQRADMRTMYDVSHDAFVVGTCARLEPIKNLGLLLDGFAGFRRSHAHHPAKLVILGDGSLRSALESRARELNIHENVLFLGSRPDVSHYLPMFDVYAITSQSEGLPLSVLEAMAAGLPVVATNVGALPALISCDTGILLSQASPDALENAFAELLHNAPTLHKKGISARLLVMKKYSLRIMVERYLDVLAEAGAAS